MRLYCFIALFLTCSPALAQHQRAAGLAGGECTRGDEQAQEKCLADVFHEWNVRMEATLRHDRDVLQENVIRHPDYAGEQKRQLAHLEKAQSQWLARRDESCKANNGTYTHVQSEDCMVSQTAARAQELEDMLLP